MGQPPVGVSAEAVAATDEPGSTDRPERALRFTPTASNVRVSGDIDLFTLPAWAEFLADLATAGDDIELDLSEVSFVDVGGAALLAHTALRLPPGCRLRVLHPPLGLRYLIDLLWGPLTTIEIAP